MAPLTPAPTVLILAPQYTHRSAGVRALYRLCVLLNAAGIDAAIAPLHPFDTQPILPVPLYVGGARPRVAIYPEIVTGNPLGAETVVRWALNYPGHLGGDCAFAESDLVFVFGDVMRQRTAELLRRPPESIETLFIPVIDPRYIYDGGDEIRRVRSALFIGHGKALHERYPMANEHLMLSIEAEATSMFHLGEALRRTRTLHSYDHGSKILKEAVVSGCKVLVMHQDGQFRDPRSCGCWYNSDWTNGFETNYATAYHDDRHVDVLLRALDCRRPGWRSPRAARAGA